MVIAAYNAVPFIARAIDSALEQAGVALQIIVVDDASIDGTADFVRDRFVADSRVTVVSLDQNAGPAGARNAALALADGCWVAVLDADDAFVQGHLAALVALGDSTGADIVAGNFLYFDVQRDEGLGPGLRIAGEIDQLDRYSFLAGARPCTGEADFGLLKPLFRNEFIRNHDLWYPVDVRHGEDVEFVFSALLEGARYFVRRDLCSYLYTNRASGFSRTRVDYGAQVSRTLSMLRWPKVRSDRRLRRLLTERANALRRLELERNWVARAVGRPAIVLQALRNAAGRSWLVSRAAKKLVG